MAEPLRPPATRTFGRENWVFVPTIANPSAPTATELTAVSTLDITRIVFASTARPTQTTNVTEAARRLGDTVIGQNVGTSTVTGGEMRYAFADQAAPAADGKKLYEKIPGGTTGFLVQRKGVARATAIAADQYVNVYPVEFGPSFPADEGDGESAESAMVCTFVITDPDGVEINVEVQAGA